MAIITGERQFKCMQYFKMFILHWETSVYALMCFRLMYLLPDFLSLLVKLVLIYLFQVMAKNR